MRSDKEILARIEAIKIDLFGVKKSDLISYLSLEGARQFFTADPPLWVWVPKSKDADDVKNEILDYMPFAWTKANNRRGLSAGRSMDHMSTWLWMIGEDLVSEGLPNYSYYGKPQLRAICEHFSWDWRKWDDDNWSNDEWGGVPANHLSPLVLPWKKKSEEEIEALVDPHKKHVGRQIIHQKTGGVYWVDNIHVKEDDLTVWFSYWGTFAEGRVTFLRPISELTDGRFRFPP